MYQCGYEDFSNVSVSYNPPVRKSAFLTFDHFLIEPPPSLQHCPYPPEATEFTELCVSQQDLSIVLSDTLPCFTCHSPLSYRTPDTMCGNHASNQTKSFNHDPSQSREPWAHPSHFCLHTSSYSRLIDLHPLRASQAKKLFSQNTAQSTATLFTSATPLLPPRD